MGVVCRFAFVHVHTSPSLPLSLSFPLSPSLSLSFSLSYSLSPSLSLTPSLLPSSLSISLALKGHGTCQAMTTITNQLTGSVIYDGGVQNCTLSVDCQEITCIATDSDGNNIIFELVLLSCVSPPAVRIVLSGEDVSYDHTFHQREEDDLHFIKSTSGSIDVRLDHPSNSSIGLRVSYM